MREHTLHGIDRTIRQTCPIEQCHPFISRLCGEELIQDLAQIVTVVHTGLIVFEPFLARELRFAEQRAEFEELLFVDGATDDVEIFLQKCVSIAQR